MVTDSLETLDQARKAVMRLCASFQRCDRDGQARVPLDRFFEALLGVEAVPPLRLHSACGLALRTGAGPGEGSLTGHLGEPRHVPFGVRHHLHFPTWWQAKYRYDEAHRALTLWLDAATPVHVQGPRDRAALVHRIHVSPARIDLVHARGRIRGDIAY